ncbi:hypothetical protein Tco_1002374 [Tanacetum coccineum]|uniref:Uncharacterized protein n=1 Tax=Tanacetum coccineum TaxID=301880 RepID=A0ABQ5F674_9ASTR
MERGFLSQKGSGVGRGVKEKQVSLSDKSAEVSKHVSVANTGSESFPTVFEAHGIPSPTNEANMNNVGTTAIPTTVGNTPGMSSYANITGEPSRKALNFHTLFTPGGNGVDVVVPVKSIRAISESYARAMIELRADAELKDTIMVAMPKLTGEEFYTCNDRVEYEWKPPSKPTIVNGEDSTSQPKEKKEPSAPQPNNKGKDVSDLQEINIVSNDVGSIMNDSDSEKVKFLCVGDNQKPMDDMVDDAHKKGDWLGKKTDSPKINIAFSPETKVYFFDRDDIDEVEHDNAYSKKG